MENLFKFLKFMLIPIRVPFGTVSLLTYGPLAMGIGLGAITANTFTIDKFGFKSGQRVRDPDIEALLKVTFGGVALFAAMANPLDWVKGIEHNDFSVPQGNNFDSPEIKSAMKSFSSHVADMPSSDREEFGKNIQLITEELARTLNGLPEPTEDKIRITNRLATPDESLTQLNHIKNCNLELSEQINSRADFDNLVESFGNEEEFRKAYDKLNFSKSFEEVKDRAETFPKSSIEEVKEVRGPLLTRSNGVPLV